MKLHIEFPEELSNSNITYNNPIYVTRLLGSINPNDIIGTAEISKDNDKLKATIDIKNQEVLERIKNIISVQSYSTVLEKEGNIITKAKLLSVSLSFKQK